jgi:ABC-type multidrug transport system fused ATPase/permease subunit
MGYNPSIDSNSKKGSFEPIIGKVEFCNVSFKYKTNPEMILKDISFTLEPGKTLGITGLTGSGKSTISQLLLRFYTITSGQILIDGKSIEDYNLKYLRERISWVGQEPVLFRGSIYYNLQLSVPGITREDAILALIEAEASDIIDIYGLDTDVGVRSSFLSGGQKQRVAIARALLRNPAVLMLDEATSALDNATEEKVRNNLKNKNISILAIAHRLNSIREFDNILLIDKGVIAQRGNHKKLSKSEGIYRQLTRGLTF